jgi:hypothetical protein
MRACWVITDDIFFEEATLNALLARITERYPRLCFISAFGDPDTLQAGATFFRRGRMIGGPLSERRCERIIKDVYRGHGRTADDDSLSEDEDAAIMLDVDVALLDAAEAHMEKYLVRHVKAMLHVRRERGRK